MSDEGSASLTTVPPGMELVPGIVWIMMDLIHHAPVRKGRLTVVSDGLYVCGPTDIIVVGPHAGRHVRSGRIPTGRTVRGISHRFRMTCDPRVKTRIVAPPTLHTEADVGEILRPFHHVQTDVLKGNGPQKGHVVLHHSHKRRVDVGQRISQISGKILARGIERYFDRSHDSVAVLTVIQNSAFVPFESLAPGVVFWLTGIERNEDWKVRGNRGYGFRR